MRYILERTTLGWCWWDLVALIVLVGVGIYYYKRIHDMKKIEEALNDRLAGTSAAEAIDAEFEG